MGADWWKPRKNRVCITLRNSGEACPIFGHANAHFSVFINRIRNKFLKK